MQEVWKDSKQNDLEDPEQYTLHDEIKIRRYQRWKPSPGETRSFKMKQIKNAENHVKSDNDLDRWSKTRRNGNKTKTENSKRFP